MGLFYSKNQILLSAKILNIPNRGVIALTKVTTDVHPKSQDKVKDNWGSKRQKRGVNKIQSNATCGDFKLITQTCTNSKGLIFNKVFQSVHRVLF
jgi:hypothetical protein